MKKQSKLNGRPKTISDISLVTTLTQFRGNYSRVAAFLNVTRTAIQNRVNDSEELAALVASLRESRIDALEESLFLAGESGEPWAVCFGLKTAGRHRGYNERQQIDMKSQLTGPNDGPIQHEHAAKPEVTQAALAAFLGDFGITFDSEPTSGGGDLQPDGTR